MCAVVVRLEPVEKSVVVSYKYLCACNFDSELAADENVEASVAAVLAIVVTGRFG